MKKSNYQSIDVTSTATIEEDVESAVENESMAESSSIHSSSSSFNFLLDGTHVIDDNRKAYNWKKFLPSSFYGMFNWIITGFSPSSELDESEVEQNAVKLARMISLLREYESQYGIPNSGGVKEQLWVLTELCSKLYAGGTPLWVLKPVMSKAAEGLTGSRLVDFVIFTRSAFIYSPSSITTASFNIERGFDMRTVTLAERILVRLSSFASNTRTVHSIRANLPQHAVLMRAARGQSVMFVRNTHTKTQERKEKMVKEILDLASEGTGLFYLLNRELHGQGIVSELNSDSDNDPNKPSDDRTHAQIRNFWKIEYPIKEIFTRLVTIEAVASLKAMQTLPCSSQLYPRWVILIFRTLSAAGAAGLWFEGSWLDMIASGLLALMVAIFEGSNLWKHEKMVFEVIVSFFVGFISGLITIFWPHMTCFQAVAVGAVTDILQGFRLVFSIMEVSESIIISSQNS